jgi:prepilin-type processing-associated H-X9-DG protein
MAPGMVTPNDPAAYPEIYGLQAIFERRNWSSDRGIWICPSQPHQWMVSYQNTYAFSIATVLKRRNIQDKRTILWVWDNFSKYPALSGYRGQGDKYNIPAAERLQPHGPQRIGYNALWLDGHVEFKRLDL